MRIFFVLSILYLITAFLLFKKTDKKIDIISWILYAIGFVFCYNTVMVFFASLINLGGSLLNYSIINMVIGTIILGVNLRKKEIQKYYLKKDCLYLVLIVMLCSFMIGYFRFDGFTTISYESGDPSVHHRHAVFFSEELEILNQYNSKDLVYGNFSDTMPGSYINCGFLINILSGVKSYSVFVFYDTLCFVLYSALFFVTLTHLFEFKKKNYLYMLALTFLYVLAFPFNNLLFGFCYLGIGIMNINLLFLFIIWFKDKLNNNIIFNIINLFFLSVSLFLTYYLYVPCIYLACGILYIYLWKKDKLSFKNLLIYGSLTLVLPFIIGFFRSMLPSFFDSNELNMFGYVTEDGDRYTNITPLIFYVYFVGYYIFDWFKNKKKRTFDFCSLNVIILSVYILIFIILYLINFSELYYLYKLFYLYWLFVIITLGFKLLDKKKFVYGLCSLIIVSVCLISMNPYNKFGDFLKKLNIYNWNFVSFFKQEVVYTADEMELVYEVNNYKDVCEFKDKAIVIKDNVKNMWFYSVTSLVPSKNIVGKGKPILFQPNVSLSFWEGMNEFPCSIYFYRSNGELTDNDFEVVYENDGGAILKKVID